MPLTTADGRGMRFLGKRTYRVVIADDSGEDREVFHVEAWSQGDAIGQGTMLWLKKHPGGVPKFVDVGKSK